MWVELELHLLTGYSKRLLGNTEEGYLKNKLVEF